MKHTTTPQTGLAIVARVAEEHGVTVADMKARKRGPAIDVARRKAYRRLVDELNWSQRRVARFFGRQPFTVHNALKPKQADTLNREDADYLLQQLNFISGQAIIYDLAQRLDLKPQRAVVLAILVRATKPLSLAAISQLYDHAWQSLRSCEHFICESTVKSAISYLRKDIIGQGLPNPVETVPPSGYMLSAEFAAWISHNLDISVGVYNTQLHGKLAA